MRAIGPALAGFGVAGTVADPRLELFAGASKSIAANENWGGGAALGAAFVAAGCVRTRRGFEGRGPGGKHYSPGVIRCR